jgi:hypothetical protein
MYYDGWWGWWPGPVYGYPFYRPIWAPAYVSFFGWGPGFGFGFGFGFGWGWGSIGWLPLGPCDRFHPWWGGYGGRFGEGRFGEFNRGGFAPLHGGTRFSNVNLAMHDANFRGATSVSAGEFGAGHMSAHAMSHAQLQNAHFSTGRLPVTPSRESYSASGRPAAASTTRNVPRNQHFFSARGATATASNARSTGNSREVARPGNSGGSTTARESGGSNGGWQKFSPMPPRSSSESGRAGESAGRTEDRGSYGSSRGSASEGRGYGPGGYGSAGRGYGGSSRPPLNMRQPIVIPRSNGGSHSAPSGGGSHSGGSSHGGGGSHGGGHGR